MLLWSMSYQEVVFNTVTVVVLSPPATLMIPIDGGDSKVGRPNEPVISAYSGMD